MTKTIKRLPLLLMLTMLLMPLGTMAKDLYCYYANSTKTLTFYYDDNKSSLTSRLSSYPDDRIYDIGGTNGWNLVRGKVEQINFDDSFWDARIAGLGGFFRDCINLKKINNFSNFNGDKCTDWSYLFYNCRSLESVDFSDFRSGPATNWSHMFDGCTALETIVGLDLVSTANATDMSYMFNNCIRLSDFDTSNFNTAKVTNMSYMFANCQSATHLDIGNFNTANVTNMSYMFNSCESILIPNLSSFNTAKVTDMTAMFSGCSKMVSIDVTSFEMSRVKGLTFMFSDCPELITIYCNCDWKDYLPSDASSNYIFDNDTKLMGGHFSTYKDSWGIDEAHPDMIGRPGAFTAKSGLIFDGHLLTAKNAQSFVLSGTITYDPDEFSLTLNNVTLKGDAGLWLPDSETLSLYLIGESSITAKGNAIEGGDIFPSALIADASLTLKSTEASGIQMWGNSVLSGDELPTGNLCLINVHGHYGAIKGVSQWYSYSNKYRSPSIILGDMELNLDSHYGTVVDGLESINEKDIAYSYDTYYFNSEKGAVYDYSVRPNGLNEGTAVTKPFKIVHKNNLEYYHVNLGGNWLNNYNADDFNPMSLSKGKVTYANNVLKLENAEFSTPYVPLDEVYGLFVQENSFLIYLKGTNSITGIDEDSYYGLYLGEDEKAASTRQWCINGLDNNASLSLMGDLYCQSLNEESKAQLSIVDSKITVTDAAYCWQEDYVDLFIRNSELDLTCAKWPDQTIMESFCSVTLQDSHFADGCYWNSAKGCVNDRSGQPATGRVRILRGSGGTKRGDVNHDDKVNTADVVAVYSFIEKGTASGITRDAANINGDSAVNTADVVAIYDIIIKGN